MNPAMVQEDAESGLCDVKLTAEVRGEEGEEREAEGRVVSVVKSRAVFRAALCTAILHLAPPDLTLCSDPANIRSHTLKVPH